MLTINVVTLFPGVFEGPLRVRILWRARERELSVGDFVLSGGEPAALCVLDAVVRLLPGALGDHESAATDSHYDGLLSPPSYTRPPSYRGMDVPAVLLSGDHEQIARWRQAEAERLTRERRPDLSVERDD